MPGVGSFEGRRPGDHIAFRGKGEHAPDGYYVADAKSEPYTLAVETTLHELLDDDGKPVVVPAGSSVFDAVYCNLVDPKATTWGRGSTLRRERWLQPYEPNAQSDGRVRVPTHMILLSGFEMQDAREPEVSEEDYDKAWRSVKGPRGQPNKYKWGPKYQRKQAEKKGAKILSDEVHSAIMDELDERGE